MINNPPRKVDIKGQPHMLAYITPEEGGILQLLGGSGEPGPMGIPQFGFGHGGDDAAGDEGGDADTGTEAGGGPGGGGGGGGGGGNGGGNGDPTGNVGGNIGPVGSTDDPDFSSASMGLSDEAMASIGSSQNKDQSFFGGPDYSVMDFGRGSVSNVTNAPNYDPNFAALNMISRGLTPSVDLRNQISFDVPPSMLPQIANPKGPPGMIPQTIGFGGKFYSPVEKALVEMEPVGVAAAIGKALSGALDTGKDLSKDATGGMDYYGYNSLFGGIFDSKSGQGFMASDDSDSNYGEDSNGDRVGFIPKPPPDTTPDPKDPPLTEEEKRRL